MAGGGPDSLQNSENEMPIVQATQSIVLHCGHPRKGNLSALL